MSQGGLNLWSSGFSERTHPSHGIRGERESTIGIIMTLTVTFTHQLPPSTRPTNTLGTPFSTKSTSSFLQAGASILLEPQNLESDAGVTLILFTVQSEGIMHSIYDARTATLTLTDLGRPYTARADDIRCKTRASHGHRGRHEIPL